MSHARSKQRRDDRYTTAVRRQIIAHRRTLLGQYRPHTYAPVSEFLRPGDTADRHGPPTRIYFMHNTLTPQNVRATWDDAIEIPAVGDTVALSCGYMGADVEWTVTAQQWLNPFAVTLLMSGPTGEVTA